ncbi:MAG: O-methyltransferase [Brumimicrobium sp.]|nr:O-methyltransferase [Brumimicrobium sp.]
MEFIDSELEDYALAHTTKEPDVLYALNRETNLKVLQPRMLSGHLQGRVLSMLSRMVRPKRILEIGTYTGYAAICLAEGLTDQGKLITIDINYELEDMVRSYFKKAGIENKVEFKIGNALDILPSLDKNFDLVFIDADKDNYSNYYDLLIDDLPSNSYLIADNVLWSGKVLLPEDEMDNDTLALKRFNEKIQSDKRVENVLMPIRDGLMIIRKI